MARTVSIIIPVKHIDNSFLLCMQRVMACSPPAHEIIVVVDGGPDRPVPASVADRVRLVQLGKPVGPAAARNRGAQLATGEILLFADADVLLPVDIVARIKAAFDHPSNPVAVFGSYDDHPVARNPVSQYKNLFHFYTHQNAQPDAFTFWTGCGGILRDFFLGMGGFSEQYRCPSIEDIELGYRIRKAGRSIFLDKTIRVTHLKRWTLRSLVGTDFRHRAIPWSRLILRYGQIDNDMNINWKNRFSVMLSWLAVPCLLLSFTSGYFIFALFFVLCCLFYSNWDLLRFFYRRKGLMFMLQAMVLQYVYYIISGTAFLLVAVQFYLGRALRISAGGKSGS